MPARPKQTKKTNETAMQIIPLMLLAIGLVTTNGSATIVDPEASSLGAAARPLRDSLAQLFSGAGHELHPLFLILLHGWIKGIQGNFDYLRLASILFYIAGILVLCRASRFFTGAAGNVSIVWLGVLWPLGFHYGRLATWYSFAFFLVSALTLSYFKYLEEPTARRLVPVFLFGAGLIWTTNFAWAILLCLVADQILRYRSKQSAGSLKIMLGVAALLAIAFIPLVAAFRAELFSSFHSQLRPITLAANAASNLLAFFTGESIGLWYWRFSIPALLAIVACFYFIVRLAPGASVRFLAYAGVLFVVLDVAGLLEPHNLLLIAPWVLLPAGIAAEAEVAEWKSYGLAAALLIAAGLGWYGVFAQRYYANPQFVEPWREISGDTAFKIGNGATVIADEPAFLFYLTFDLGLPRHNGPWQFSGLLPDAQKHPQVFSPESWLASKNAPSGKVLLVRGAEDLQEGGTFGDVAKGLDQACGSISSRLRTRDEGYIWKQRYLPQLDAPQWRIEIREYGCDSSNSKQLYPLPPPGPGH